MDVLDSKSVILLTIFASLLHGSRGTGQTFKSNCSSYTVHTPPKESNPNWKKSVSLCHAENGGALVSIETQTELNFFEKKRLENNLNYEYFIGLEKYNDTLWKWVSGNGTVTSLGWASGNGNCVKMYFQSSVGVVYDDIDCEKDKGSRIGYICERPSYCEGSQASRPREGCFNSTPDLGMARGTIPDSDITASSMINSHSPPHFARLGNSKAWTADRNDLTPWIQVNLQKAINVTAIATQGLSGSYIRQYYLSYSVSGNQWMNYTTQGVTKVFQVNQNDAMLATVVLNPLVVAQYIRLHPTNCSKFCTLRMELYGCNSTAGFPGRPPAPTVSSTSATSISIQWNAPDEVGDGITGYHVRWQEEGVSILKQKVVTSGRVTILDKLTPYTWYTIQVQPYNNKGVGLWSEELRVRSNESVPSVAPGNFKLGSSSSLSLDVSWDAIHAEQQQGKLLGYRIVYKKNGSEVNHTKDVGPSQYSLKIEKLEYASYAVKVAGYTRVGVGKFTEPKSRFPNEGESCIPPLMVLATPMLEKMENTVIYRISACCQECTYHVQQKSDRRNIQLIALFGSQNRPKLPC